MDRYLQTLMPGSRQPRARSSFGFGTRGLASKLALLMLIGAQVVVGGDVYFIQSHAMIRSPIKRVNDLLSAGYKKQYEERLEVFTTWTRARDALPEDAHVLLHDNHTHLGLARRTTSDWGAWQFGITYGRLRSRRRYGTFVASSVSRMSSGKTRRRKAGTRSPETSVLGFRAEPYGRSATVEAFHREDA